MMASSVKRVVFLTGTRADFGKLKPLIKVIDECPGFELHLFVTGMHMLTKYGYTCAEVENAGYGRIHKYINQNQNDSMDSVLGKTITGFSDYVKEIRPDMIVVHGDRIEALGGAIVGSLNNIYVSHIEGGEVSGTIDELIRHAVTKMSHWHFVANENAAKRLIQLGEEKCNIFTIGSPDIDIMNSNDLPVLDDVRTHYDIEFDQYSILLYHPVTTDSAPSIVSETEDLLAELIASNRCYVVLYPNNDLGSDLILNAFDQLRGNVKFRVIPSMRFEYFLTLMKNAEFLIGNSSAGIREAPHFGVPAINIGSRQENRASSQMIINCLPNRIAIRAAIKTAAACDRVSDQQFGDGNSAELYLSVIEEDAIWKRGTQKYFVDMS
jgi:UDP-N-acetylglucosamine 2-epimerase (hydrolysing)